MNQPLLKKVEERFVAQIVYKYDGIDEVEYDTFEIVKDDGCEPRYMIKAHEQWRSKEDAIRYYENLLNIIKTEL